MSDIVGTWRLVASAAYDPDGKPLPQPYGPKPMGIVTFNGDGRMMAVLCDGRSEVTGEREYNSYCGNYRFDGKTLTTRVDATAKAEMLGTEQVRATHFEGNRLTLRPPLRPFGAHTTQQRELTWERVG